MAVLIKKNKKYLYQLAIVINHIWNSTYHANAIGSHFVVN
jgi:hypothetical protein